jgi:hypothetical protein
MEFIMTDKQAARGLGWTSLAIGLAEVLAPRQLERTMGISNGRNTGILRVCGVREIAQGIDILAHDDPTHGVLARVAGDMLDGVLLGAAAMKTKRPGGFSAVCAMVLGVVAMDVLYAQRLSRKRFFS